MATNANWPLTSCMVAFNSGFATTTIPVWSDLTPRMWSLACDRGRQYELDQTQAGQGGIVFADKDEALNTANPSSPYAGNVLPYRQILNQAQWPPAPVGAAVNLLNLSAQPPGPYDPGFESYTSGSLPSWISAVGGVTASVGTGGARTGSQRLGYTVANGTTVQGVAWQVPCIPGQQYISSAYVSQAAASTQSLRVTDQNQVIDAFNRTVASGWGTADLGGAWTTSGGVATDYNVAAGSATLTLSTTNASRKVVAGSVADSDVRVTVTIPAVATGVPIDVEAISRYADSSNYYNCGIQFGTDTSVTARLSKVFTGTGTVLATAALGVAYTAGSVWNLRVQTQGPVLRAKVWVFGATEPSAWTVTTTDTSLTAAGAVGCRAIAETGNTNTSPVIGYQNFSAAGSVTGTTTTTTGSYVRLTVTWTATQPLHTIQLATSGTAVAGAVLVDDLQHEPGGSASTATTTGPVIYGVHRGYVERWPINWNHQGMYGYCQITTVDAFAALAARKLHTEYASAVLAKNPDFYWRLSEPNGATSFAETSGSHGPSLTRIDSRSGAGATFAPGTNTNIAGDPNGTGIHIASTFPAGSGLQVGASPAPFSVGATAPPWTLTASMWFTADPAGNAGFALILFNYSATNNAIALYISEGPTAAQAQIGLGTSTGGLDFQNVTCAAFNGKLHHLVGTVNFASTTSATYALWVDGVQVLTRTFNPTTVFGANLNTLSSSLQLAADMGPFFSDYNGQSGTYSHIAVWRRVLSNAEIADLWSAGGGYLGETSGARVARYLSFGAYPGLASFDTGQSLMGADVLTENTILLDACQAVTLTENGNFWATGTGTLTFTSRTRRYLNTTVKWVFGENQGGGENPYETDVAYDDDATLVYNDVTVTNSGGAEPEVGDDTSQANYGPRSYQRSVNLQNDNEATDAANWILSTHKDPHQRIATLTIKPSANPALWPVALGAEIGDRVTVVRRTTQFTMSSDYFIEQIAHSQKPDEWTVSFQMSPASLWPIPWILGDATYGVLGTTTRLGY